MPATSINLVGLAQERMNNMKAPDKIYMPQHNIQELDKLIVEYVRKDALLEWAKELKERWEEPPMSKHSPGCVYMLEQLIDKLNSM